MVSKYVTLVLLMCKASSMASVPDASSTRVQYALHALRRSVLLADVQNRLKGHFMHCPACCSQKQGPLKPNAFFVALHANTLHARQQLPIKQLPCIRPDLAEHAAQQKC